MPKKQLKRLGHSDAPFSVKMKSDGRITTGRKIFFDVLELYD